MKHKGFTLAEVLITLGIIGVVAAMTIPTLIANTNSQKFRVQFKKTISTMNQAARMAIAQYDLDFAAVSATCGENPATDTLTSGTSTICGVLNSTLAGATYIDNFFDDYTIDDNGEQSVYEDGDTWYVYQLADGSVVGILQENKSCTLEDPCLGFVDVNGKTKPNKQVHGEEVTAYNRILDLAAYGDTLLPIKKGCPEMYCPGGGHVDQTTCQCVGGTGGGGINLGGGTGTGISISGPLCETKCYPGFIQTSSCACIAKEPDPSPDPTYNVPADVNHLTDVYPVAIYDHTVMPASRAAWYVLTTTKSDAASAKKSNDSKDDDVKDLEPAETLKPIDYKVDPYPDNKKVL